MTDTSSQQPLFDGFEPQAFEQLQFNRMNGHSDMLLKALSLASIAISLKRIADSRQRYPTSNTNWAQGEDANKSNLTAADVRQIRARYEDGAVTQQELADEYGLSLTSIHKIVKGKSWRHVL